ncbi:capsular exopolysaccharide family [Granulicatella balaenopterae]|uniref:Tyrosine-protein kinase CpsD n=1 Tax=Granulicatella balaenopterae TaxID=137733 RepID=A0A1H9K964_9LACT|nr:CpsD/CapB family tyrosine-protein kinase [Granulicatella balaenopterae]SEQ95385.1 capsular exopolysaccharide family [Granulicatella balaenopterae]
MEQITINLPYMDYFANEAYKALRTNLGFCGKEKKAITITSYSPAEGKSTTIINLARTLTESGQKVLIIDGDLRKSSLVSKLKAIGANKGLSHYLSHQASLEEVIYSTNVNKLDIIFSGPVPPNPAELLEGDLFSMTLNSLKDYYDYILIDAPPVGSVIDAAVIAESCDGIIMVIESGTVSHKDEQEVKKQLEKTNSPILGVILNKVKHSGKGYYQKYGKYEH